MIKLEKISEIYFDSLKEMKQNYIENAEGRIQGSGALEKYNDLNEWFESINRIEQGLDNNVDKCYYYLIVLDEEVIGTMCYRPILTESLFDFGGQIGYSIKPSQRKKAYMSQALKLLLNEIKEDVIIMTELNNIASNKIIIKSGGVLIDTVIKYGLNINRYKIPSSNQ